MANLAGNSYALPWSAQAGCTVSVLVDLAEHPLGATESHQVINVPEGAYVQAVTVNVISADTGSSTRTFHVGDEDDPDGFAVAVDATTAGRTLGAGAYAAAGRLYEADGAIVLTAVEELVDAVVEVRALVAPM